MTPRVSATHPSNKNSSASDPLHTDLEVAALLNPSDNTLAVWRSKKREGPPYIKLGQAVCYQLSSVNQCIESCKIISGGGKND